MKKNNIILIGMPGCGKSTLGVVLAKMLCLDFLDLDLVIQKRIGMTLQDYIDKNGVDAFLELEADIANTLECENTVLATGGSAVLRERAAKHLKTLGKTVYISLPLEDIEKRITDLSSRGVAMTRGETLGDVYERRVPIYEKYSDIKVDIKDKTIAESCAMLCEIIKSEANNE